MSRPQNYLNLTPTLKVAYFFAPKNQKEITLKLGSVQVLHQRVGGGWGVWQKLLMLLMLLGGVGGLRSKLLM